MELFDNDNNVLPDIIKAFSYQVFIRKLKIQLLNLDFDYLRRCNKFAITFLLQFLAMKKMNRVYCQPYLSLTKNRLRMSRLPYTKSLCQRNLT